MSLWAVAHDQSQNAMDAIAVFTQLEIFLQAYSLLSRFASTISAILIRKLAKRGRRECMGKREG